MEFSLQDIFAEIDRQAEKFGVNPRTAKALMLAENTSDGSMATRTSFRTDAVSPAGARGLMQVMPDTATGLQKAGFLPPEWKYDANNLASNVSAGLAALQEKLGRMNNPDDLGELASVYNGSTKTHKAYKAGLFDKLPAEIQQYTKKLRRADMELGGHPVNNPSAYVAPTAGTGGMPSGGSTSTNSRTTRSTSFDPEALASFTDTITQQVRPGGEFDNTAQLINTQAAVRNETASALQKSIIEQGIAAGAEATASAVTAASNAATRAKILSDMNLNPAANNNAMLQALGVISSADTELASMKPEIDSRMAVGFFDNPLEWFINQTRLPGMVAKYNSTVDTKNNAAASYAERALIASTQQSLSAVTDADALLRQGKTVAASAAAKAQAEALRVSYDTAGATQRDAMTLVALTGQKIDLMNKALQQSKQTVSDTESMTERQKTVKEETDVLAGVNRVIVMAGGAPLSTTLFKQQSGKKRDILISAATSGKFGQDFAESFELVGNSGDVQRMAANGGATIVKWVNGTNAKADELIAAEATKAAAARTRYDAKAARPAVLNKIQQSYEAEAKVNMRGASPYNPYTLDYVSIAKDPAMKDNKLAALIREYGPKGNQPFMAKVDEQFIFNEFAKEGIIGVRSAAESAKIISDFYTFGTTKQALKYTQWALFGMSKPEKTYVIRLEGPGTPAVDFGNQGDVERALMVKITREQIKQESLDYGEAAAAMSGHGAQ